MFILPSILNYIKLILYNLKISRKNKSKMGSEQSAEQKQIDQFKSELAEDQKIIDEASKKLKEIKAEIDVINNVSDIYNGNDEIH